MYLDRGYTNVFVAAMLSRNPTSPTHEMETPPFRWAVGGARRSASRHRQPLIPPLTTSMLVLISVGLYVLTVMVTRKLRTADSSATIVLLQNTTHAARLLDSLYAGRPAARL